MKLQLFFKCKGKNADIIIALKYTIKIVATTWFMLMVVLYLLNKVIYLASSIMLR